MPPSCTGATPAPAAAEPAPAAAAPAPQASPARAAARRGYCLFSRLGNPLVPSHLKPTDLHGKLMEIKDVCQGRFFLTHSHFDKPEHTMQHTNACQKWLTDTNTTRDQTNPNNTAPTQITSLPLSKNAQGDQNHTKPTYSQKQNNPTLPACLGALEAR